MVITSSLLISDSLKFILISHCTNRSYGCGSITDTALAPIVLLTLRCEICFPDINQEIETTCPWMLNRAKMIERPYLWPAALSRWGSCGSKFISYSKCGQSKRELGILGGDSHTLTHTCTCTHTHKQSILKHSPEYGVLGWGS
jgi:hypothetical protein